MSTLLAAAAASYSVNDGVKKKVAQRIGKKRALIIVTLPLFACWLLVYLADNLTLLMLSRFLGGFAGGGIFALVPRLVSVAFFLSGVAVAFCFKRVVSARLVIGYKRLHNENLISVIVM